MNTLKNTFLILVIVTFFINSASLSQEKAFDANKVNGADKASIKKIIIKPDKSKTKNKKSNFNKAIYFSVDFGAATTRMNDSIPKFDNVTIHASLGYWNKSFVFPIALNLSYSSGDDEQTDVFLTMVGAFGSGNGNIFLIGSFGPGISFGTTHVRNEQGIPLRTEDYTLPALLCDGGLILSQDNMGFGLKGSFNVNKKRTLFGITATILFFVPI